MTARHDIGPEAILEAARDYARRGIAVFPLHHVLPQLPPNDDKFMCSCGRLTCGANAGKHPFAPLVPHGFKDATTDEAKVRHWWLYRSGANIGIRTGGVFFVLDVDPRNGGVESMRELQAKHGKLPSPTPRAMTGGGGWHVYLKDPTGQMGCRMLAPGVDIKGLGGYVLGPPSNHLSGNSYRWQLNLDVPFAEAPAWMLDLASKGAIARPTEHWRGLIESTVEGSRNVTLDGQAVAVPRRPRPYQQHPPRLESDVRAAGGQALGGEQD
jgi:hypothetical protein